MTYLKSVLFLLTCCASMAADESFSLNGIPRYGSSPARNLSPALGFWAESFDFVDEMTLGAGGELGRGRLRIGFLEEYTWLDSIYRRSYSEVDAGYTFSCFVIGAGYGFSMEWIPAGTLWVRHRYKLGASLEWKKMYFGGMLVGWTDDVLRLEFLLGGGLNAGDQVNFHWEWDGGFLTVGSNVKIRKVDISFAYRFPGFGASFSISFLLDSWLFDGTYSFSNESFDRFEMGISKKLEKKTIL